jgi:hypothetical protein
VSPVVLAETEWRPRQARYQNQVDELLAGHRERADRGTPHPVEDFLFTYYSHRPSQLRRWHPGAGVALAGPAAAERQSWRDHVLVADPNTPGGPAAAVTVDVTAFLARRGGALRHVLELLTATAGRTAQLGCFGLHEWAMVYRQDAEQVRHAGRPLRLGPAGTDAVVEQHRIRCTHHDAFRFFTAEARPLNQLQPERGDQVALEQPGCLHATMDLYKWAYKLAPALPSELTLDCFRLARRTRELDMRASPYDLSDLGYHPVRIETVDGKAEYVQQQREIAAQGQQLRARLLTACRSVLALGPAEPDGPGSTPGSEPLDSATESLSLAPGSTAAAGR